MLSCSRPIGLNFYLFRDDAAKLLSGAGHGLDDRLDPGRSEHFVPVDEAEARAVQAIVQEIRRWNASSASPAAGRSIPASSSFAQALGSATSPPTAWSTRLRGKLAQVAGRAAVPASRFRISAPAAGRATRPISIRCWATTPPTLQMGAQADGGAAEARSPEGRQFRPAAGRPGGRCQFDRATAKRLGLTMCAIDNTLYDAFGQRQVSTIYKR